MRGNSGRIGIVLALAALLASLGVVTWRHSRALELSRAVEDARLARSLEEVEKARLEERIRELESRSRVVRDASARLGMRLPNAAEIVILRVPATASGTGAAAMAPPASRLARLRAARAGLLPGGEPAGLGERSLAGRGGVAAELPGGAE